MLTRQELASGKVLLELTVAGVTLYSIMVHQPDAEAFLHDRLHDCGDDWTEERSRSQARVLPLKRA